MKLYDAKLTNETLFTGSFTHLLRSEMILFLHEILKFGVTELGRRGLSNGVGSHCNLSYPKGLQGGAEGIALPGFA